MAVKLSDNENAPVSENGWVGVNLEVPAKESDRVNEDDRTSGFEAVNIPDALISHDADSALEIVNLSETEKTDDSLK